MCSKLSLLMACTEGAVCHAASTSVLLVRTTRLYIS
jgi:hypothetical protein